MITAGSTTAVNFYVIDDDGLSATGKASSITVNISIDGATATAATVTIMEIDSTNQPGWYSFPYTFTTAGNYFITFAATNCVIAPWEEYACTASGASASDIATAVWEADLSSYWNTIYTYRAATLIHQYTPANIWQYDIRVLPTNSIGNKIWQLPLLTSIQDGLAIPTTAQIASAVCDEELSSHTTSGTLGATISETATATTATAISSAVAEINTAVGVIDSTVDSMQQTVLTINSNVQAISGYTDELEGMVQDLPTSSAIADTVWNRTAGNTARTLTASPTDISSLATSASVSALQTAVNAIPTNVYTIPTVSAIQNGLAKTTDIPTDYATSTALTAVKTAVDAIPTTTYTIPTVTDIQSGLAKTTELPTDYATSTALDNLTYAISPAAGRVNFGSILDMNIDAFAIRVDKNNYKGFSIATW